MKYLLLLISTISFAKTIPCRGPTPSGVICDDMVVHRKIKTDWVKYYCVDSKPRDLQNCNPEHTVCTGFAPTDQEKFQELQRQVDCLNARLNKIAPPSGQGGGV